MAHYNRPELEQRYERLPAVLKEALFSAEVAEKIFEIGKKSGLTIEKVGFVAEETGFVILGLTPPREFVSALAQRLETDAETARKVSLEINHQIFFPLREALRQAHQVEVGEAALQKEAFVPGKTPAPLVLQRIEARPPEPAAQTPPAPRPIEKEIAPLLEGIPKMQTPMPAKFLTRDEA